MLCADSTCDLSPQLKERFHVVTCPLHVVLEDKVYDDGVNMMPDDIYAVYAQKKVLPKTAAANAAEYMEFFKPYLDDGYEIVYISLGSALSVSHTNCRMAAAECDGVYVVDSCNLSTGSGLLVLEAADRIAAGMPAAQVAEEVQALVSKSHASFVVDTLEFLHKGGRCSALAMLGANLLQLKPCIEVDTAACGKMDVGKKYRGSLEKSLQQYVQDKLEGRTDIRRNRVFITHSGISEERLNLVKEAVESYNLFDEIFITRAGCTISAHCGPNTLGVLFMTK
ncbi:MAG: DegV family protein [Clostridia bacterium]|nr:DegV family protein [Clostridia bacterium]